MEKIDHSSDYSFPNKLRISSSKTFSHLIKNGEKLTTNNFIIYYIHNNLGYPRIGISVSKKISKKSVARNRIKRLLREAFRLNKVIFNGLDLVIIVKKDISKNQTVEVATELKKLFNNKSAK